MMGFLSATTSILSELDDSACQRHRSVGGFLLRLAAYVKRILRHHKKYINPQSTQNCIRQSGMENTKLRCQYIASILQVVPFCTEPCFSLKQINDAVISSYARYD